MTSLTACISKTTQWQQLAKLQRCIAEEFNYGRDLSRVSSTERSGADTAHSACADAVCATFWSHAERHVAVQQSVGAVHVSLVSTRFTCIPVQNMSKDMTRDDIFLRSTLCIGMHMGTAHTGPKQVVSLACRNDKGYVSHILHMWILL